MITHLLRTDHLLTLAITMLDDTLQREGRCPGRIMLIKDPDQVPECLSLGPTSNDSDPAEQQAILDRIRSKSTQLRGLIFIGTRVMRGKPYSADVVFAWVYGQQGKAHRRWCLASGQRREVINDPGIAFCFLDAVTPNPPYSCDASDASMSLFAQHAASATRNQLGDLRRPIVFLGFEDDSSPEGTCKCLSQ